MGVGIDEVEDGITIHGPIQQQDTAAAIPATEDHRVVMALTLLGTVVDSGIVLCNEAAVAKSWPGYFDWLVRVANVTKD